MISRQKYFMKKFALKYFLFKKTKLPITSTKQFLSGSLLISGIFASIICVYKNHYL